MSEDQRSFALLVKWSRFPRADFALAIGCRGAYDKYFGPAMTDQNVQLSTRRAHSDALCRMVSHRQNRRLTQRLAKFLALRKCCAASPTEFITFDIILIDRNKCTVQSRASRN